MKNTNNTEEEALNIAKEFFELNRTDVIRGMSGENKVVNVDFDEFSAHSPELAEHLIDRPEETIQLLEIALEDFYKFLNSKKVNDDETWQLRKKPLYLH